jgi:hypothetical protein
MPDLGGTKKLGHPAGQELAGRLEKVQEFASRLETVPEAPAA